MSSCLSHRVTGRGALFSRLASDGSLTLLGEFSGQGRPWLGSLREVYNWSLESNSLRARTLRTLVERAAAQVDKLVQEEEMQMLGVFKQGFQVMEWIRQPDSAPKESYLAKSD